MTLATGARIGSYEIVGPLGVGGMGEVYRARDTKLGRDVALKVLPDLFADDPDRLARFQREAQLLASLNHPNIAHIHGLEDDGAIRALVMELIEGDDLAQRLARGPIAVAEALPIARQIAAALEAAHEQGIVHRDLKPANIKIRDDGTVKVLDFGLAKALESTVPSSAQVTNSPTISVQATQAGIILGTAAYMAPEQAQGRPADRRADVFAFGSVLFEMLAGTPAFAGESVGDTLASVLKVEPDWSGLPAATPPAVRALLRRCLTKDRTQRLQAIGEARIAIAQPAVEQSAAAAEPLSIAARPWMVATALATIVAAATTWGWLRPRLPSRQPILRFASDIAVANAPGGLALSPDGTRLAFVAEPGRRIHVRSLDQFSATALPNTENASFLCFSPDGQWISYIAGDQSSQSTQLMKIAVSGGPAQKLADAPSVVGPPTQYWGADGNIVFNANGALLRISSSGGQPETLATPDAKSRERFYAAPQLLPGGDELLVTISGGPGLASTRVVAFNLATRRKKVLIERVGLAQFVPAGANALSGHLVSYDATASSLVAVPFDAKRLEIAGAPVPLIDEVKSAGPFGAFALSGSGMLVYVPGRSAVSSTRAMVWVDRRGSEQPTGAPLRQYNLPRLSPDGARIAVEVEDPDSGTADVWVYDLTRQVLSRITSQGTNINPIWTPDGRRLIYATSVASTTLEMRSPPTTRGVQLMSTPVDRSESPTAFVSDASILPTSVAPDGTVIIGQTNAPLNAVNEIAAVPFVLPSARVEARAFPTSRFRKSGAQLSPDGRWVAFSSTDSGRNEIYVSAYPGPGSTFQISTDGGLVPRWSGDGREVFFRSGSRMMAVAVQLEPSFRAGRPELLFEGTYNGNGYDVARDGTRFLMVRNDATMVRQTDHPNIVVNWIEELKARVPTK